MIEIYGTPASRTSRVLWALEEIGLEYEHHNVHHKRGENREAGFLAISPDGRIPVLKQGENIVRQSLAINLYLATEFGPNALMPNDPLLRAACFEWTFWAACEVEPHSFYRLVESAKPADARDERALARGDAALAAALDYLELMLENRSYLVADRFTLADLNAVGPLEYCQRSGLDFSCWQAVSSWLARCQERPAYAKISAMKAAA